MGANTTWLIFDGKKRQQIVTVERPSELRSWISPDILLTKSRPEVQRVTDYDHDGHRQEELESYLNELEKMSDTEESKENIHHDSPKERWLKSLDEEKEAIKKIFGDQVETQPSGMVQIRDARDGRIRIYVPKRERDEVIMREHKKKFLSIFLDD